ncbi:hypothetical protein KZ829_07375 [Actinoplanes hulinensis]|uniref:Uncharacterized protein n=2 Tax=Actinoplanes hulinensis TaxID=1144547 RepID=A0ABS7AYB4_9ACTN|nr:hypothetical protein [Actinoplanes hulinensis]
MDTFGIEPTDDMGAAPSVARLLLELRGRTRVDVRPSGRSLQVRPKDSNVIAVHIHPGGIDLALDQDRANEVALSIEGAYVRDDEPVTQVSVEAYLIDANYDALLDAAVEAVEQRAAGKPVKAAAAAPRARATSTGTRAPAKPKAAAKPAPRPEPPRCPKCRQYELLASGECPSGYC